MTQGKDDLMGMFTDYDCHDVCPRDIAAFRVVNKLADSSTIHRVTGRENYALTFVAEGRLSTIMTHQIAQFAFRAMTSKASNAARGR